MVAALDWLWQYAANRQNKNAAKNVADNRPSGGTIKSPNPADADFEQFLVEFLNHTGTQLTPTTIINILTSADQGQPADQAALFSTIQEKEPLIAAHLQTRKRAVLASNWSVQHDDDTKSEEMTTILQNAGIHKLQEHLLDAIGTGYAGSATMWEDGGATISGWKHADPTAWLFDQVGNPAVQTVDGKKLGIYSDYPPYQWCYHEQKLKPGLPARGGILRALTWLYFFKHFGIKQFARYIERFGTPFMLAQVTEEDWDDQTRLNKTLGLLRNIGKNGVAAVKKGTEVELQKGLTSGNADVYNQWFEYLDTIIAVLILGQSASSGDSSGLSGGDSQSAVRQDLLEADCLNLMETLTLQVVRPLERFKYGTAEATFKLDYEPPEDITEKAEVVKTLADAGYKAERKWVSDTFEIPLQDEPDEPPPVTPPANLPPLTDTLSLTDSGIVRDEFIGRLTENTLRRLFVTTEAMAEFTGPVKAEIHAMFADIDPDADDITEQFSARVTSFFERFPAMYDTMDAEKFETELKGAMTSGLVYGFK